MTRATSPQPDPDKQIRTRIARTTDPCELISRRSRPPRTVQVAVQTVQTDEYGPLTFTDRVVMPSDNFDYYALVKKSVAQMSEKPIVLQEPEEDEEDLAACVIKKAPMMEILPGTTPMPKPVPAKALPESEDDDESEYEYETEEEDEEEEVDDENGEPDVNGATYESLAENILEDNSDLDYIDDDDDENDMQRLKTRNKRKKKTFISGTIDIDILLGKESTPNTLMDNNAPQLASSTPRRSSIDFSNAIPSKDLGDEEAPWWLKQKYPLQYSPSNKSLGQQQLVSNEEDQNGYEDCNGDDTEDPTSTTGADVTVTDGNWDEDEDEYEYDEDDEEAEEGEEGDWEWEYYNEDGESGQGEAEGEEEEIPVKSATPVDERTPWIADGLANLVPKIPAKSNILDDEDDDEEGVVDENEQSQRESNSVYENTDTGKEKGYKEWLEESAVFEDNVEDLLDMNEEESKTEDHAENGAQEPTPDGPAVSPKAKKLITKLTE